MAVPRFFLYDQASQETVVTAGVDALELVGSWLSIPQKKLSIVVREGVINGDESGLDYVAKKEQVDLADDELTAWYTANKTVVDAYLTALRDLAVSKLGKTGSPA